MPLVQGSADTLLRVKSASELAVCVSGHTFEVHRHSLTAALLLWCPAVSVPGPSCRPVAPSSYCRLKRAGLDYWNKVCVRLHTDWDAFYAYFQSLPAPQRLVGYSVYGDQYYGAPGACATPREMHLADGMRGISALAFADW